MLPARHRHLAEAAVNQATQSIPQPYLIPPTGGCKAAWKLDNSWQGGLQGATSAANPWSVTLTLPAGTTVSNGWNGTLTQTGTTVTVTAPSHSPALSPGAAVSLGFTANGTTAAPSAVALNQVACTT
ncbi:cellulose binding domain-containing protein [Lentzea atacamensis]|uniref:Cellulose binding domain-containing protein n=1 Tax=Lentzea atacamensis TaxID=531938 RepID=A0ABX9EDP8_9PSEU|nr:cellulose binding domain-containing protein [Lentzea atacamensis]RAS67048.1 cellulose binding domain-containing protein [Lentzea atacamensis]